MSSVPIVCLYFKHIQGPTRDRHGRNRMAVGILTTYAISAYHHERCEFESRSGEVYSIQHYVIKIVSDMRQVRVFFPGYSGLLQQ